MSKSKMRAKVVPGDERADAEAEREARAKDLIYALVAGGAGIKCLLCDARSFNPNDVREKYCRRCELFHEVLEVARLIGPEALSQARRAADSYQRQVLRYRQWKSKGTGVVNLGDYRLPDGGLDWRAYDRAKLDAGEKCEQCGAFLVPALGRRGRCHACVDLAAAPADRSVRHELLIRCPGCRRASKPSDGPAGHVLEEGEHRVECECGCVFLVETRLTYHFTSRPAGGSSGGE